MKIAENFQITILYENFQHIIYIYIKHFIFLHYDL